VSSASRLLSAGQEAVVLLLQARHDRGDLGRLLDLLVDARAHRRACSARPACGRSRPLTCARLSSSTDAAAGSSVSER
jgi:hypothetical protein